MEHQDLWAHKAKMVSLGSLARQDQLALLVLQDQQGRMVHREQLEVQDRLVEQDHLDLQVLKDLMDNQEQLGHRVHVVIPVSQALRAALVPLEQLAHQDRQVFKVHQDQLDQWDRLELVDPVVLAGLKEQLDRLAH